MYIVHCKEENIGVAPITLRSDEVCFVDIAPNGLGHSDLYN